MASALKEYTVAEVAQHKTLEDLWLIIDNYVRQSSGF
jgi:cytochrome b involved in lipid metabolism